MEELPLQLPPAEYAGAAGPTEQGLRAICLCYRALLLLGLCVMGVVLAVKEWEWELEYWDVAGSSCVHVFGSVRCALHTRPF